MFCYVCVDGEGLGPLQLDFWDTDAHIGNPRNDRLDLERDTDNGNPKRSKKGVRGSDPYTDPDLIDSAEGVEKNIKDIDSDHASHISDDSDTDIEPRTDYRKSGWGWEEDLPLNHPTYGGAPSAPKWKTSKNTSL